MFGASDRRSIARQVRTRARRTPDCPPTNSDPSSLVICLQRPSEGRQKRGSYTNLSPDDARRKRSNLVQMGNVTGAEESFMEYMIREKSCLLNQIFGFKYWSTRGLGYAACSDNSLRTRARTVQILVINVQNHCKTSSTNCSCKRD